MIKIYPPNYHYNLSRATVQFDISTRLCDVEFSELATQASESDKPTYAPAVVETIDIATLYARHLISAFMWAAVEHIDSGTIDIRTGAKEKPISKGKDQKLPKITWQ